MSLFLLQRDVSKKAKIIWFSMLSVSLSFFCVEIYNVFQEYARHPVGSQWTRKSENVFSFPAILFCPERWINETKAIKDYGFSNLSIVFLAAYTIVENPSLQEHTLFPGVVNNYSWVKEEVERVIAEHQIPEPSIPNLLIKLAYDLQEIITYSNPFMGMAIDNVSVNEQMVVTNYGVCYKRVIPKYTKEMMPTPIGDLRMDLRFPESVILRRPNLVKVFVGYYDGDPLPAHPLTLSKGKSYQVKVKSTHSMQIRSEKNLCEEGLLDSSFRRACEYHCFNEALWTPCYGCHFKAGLDMPYDQLCNPIYIMVDNINTANNQSTRVKRHDCDEHNWAEKFEKCLSECPKEPCDMWTHELSVVDTPLDMFVTDNNALQSAQLWLSSATPFVHLEMKEIWTYTWHTFISNIGGQMGLWLGVSLLSLLRLWQTCCMNAYKGYRGLHAEINIKRAHKKSVAEGMAQSFWLNGQTAVDNDTININPHRQSNGENNSNSHFTRALLPTYWCDHKPSNHIPECEIHMV